MTPHEHLQVAAGVRHLHALGPRALFEFVIELAEPVGEIPFLLGRLEAYHEITPELLRAVGADRFPCRIWLVSNE